MADAFRYPGVYIEDATSSRTISGISTADTAFVDIFERGPVHTPTLCTSFGEAQAIFGDL